MDELKIITNNVPRDVIDSWALTPKERKEFDYLDWEAIEAGNDAASFFRYRGELYDLSEIESIPSRHRQPIRMFPNPWQGYSPDSFFSGILVRYIDDLERVIVGRYYS